MVDRFWDHLPNGRLICEIGRQGRIREYYFKFLIHPFCEYTGYSTAEAHDFFKSKFYHHYTDGSLKSFSVFSQSSKLSEQDKESFANEVRSFLFRHEINTESFRNND
jgi:hypothetical protein